MYHGVAEAHSKQGLGDQHSMNKILREMSRSRCQVVIVGAGAAGLSAGVKLQQLGVEDVMILEAAEDRVGGRVWSRGVRDGGARVEQGAQWIHGEDGNVVHQMAQQLGFLPDNNDECIEETEAVFIKNGEIVPEDKIRPIMMTLSNLEESLKNTDQKTLETYNNAEEFFRAGLDELVDDDDLSRSYFHWFSQLQASIDGSPRMADTAVYQNIVYQASRPSTLPEIILIKNYWRTTLRL